MRLPDAYRPWLVGVWGAACIAVFAAALFVDSRLIILVVLLFIVYAAAGRPLRCPDCRQHQLKRYVWPDRRFDPDTMEMPPRCASCGAQLPMQR
ncbi:MAG: hypothetical protein RLO02_16290 [Roseitalea porphyridii]